MKAYSGNNREAGELENPLQLGSISLSNQTQQLPHVPQSLTHTY